MKLLSALLIDNIVKHSDGRVDLIGLFEAVYFDSTPFILESVSLFAEVAFEDSDRGRDHTIAFRVDAPDGHVAHTSPPFRFTAPLQSEYPRTVAQLDLALLRVPFPEFGAYRIHIAVNGVVDRTLPLDVLQTPTKS